MPGLIKIYWFIYANLRQSIRGQRIHYNEHSGSSESVAKECSPAARKQNPVSILDNRSHSPVVSGQWSEKRGQARLTDLEAPEVLDCFHVERLSGSAKSVRAADVRSYGVNLIHAYAA